MINRMKQILDDYNKITTKISNPNIMADIKEYTKLAKEAKYFSRFIPRVKEYIKIYNQLKEDEDILLGDDAELKELVKEELTELKQNLKNLENNLKIDLLPRNPNDDRNVIFEIRSGTGGNEAALFVEDLYRMYLRFCETSKLKQEVLSLSVNEGGGD